MLRCVCWRLIVCVLWLLALLCCVHGQSLTCSLSASSSNFAMPTLVSVSCNVVAGYSNYTAGYALSGSLNTAAVQATLNLVSSVMSTSVNLSTCGTYDFQVTATAASTTTSTTTTTTAMSSSTPIPTTSTSTSTSTPSVTSASSLTWSGSILVPANASYLFSRTTNISMQTITPFWASLSWTTAPSVCNATYAVSINGNSGLQNFSTPTASANGIQNFTNLNANSPYQVQLQALYVYQPSSAANSASSTLSFNTTQAAPSNAPIVVVSVTVSGNTTSSLTSSVNISWSPPTTPNGNLVEYTVATSLNSSPQNTTVSAPISNLVLNGLLGCTTYAVQVAAKTVAYGPFSNSTTFQSGPYNINVPQATVQSSVNQFSVLFSSSKSVNDSACLVTYIIRAYNDTVCNTAPVSVWSSIADNTSVTLQVSSFNVSGVSTPVLGNHMYSIQVAAVQASYVTNWSTCQQFTTLFSAPTNLVAASNASSTTLSWNAPSSVDFTNCSYLVTWKNGSQSVPAYQTSVVISGLSACTPYTFWLQLACRSSNASSINVNTTTSAAAPAPSSVTAISNTSTTMFVYWTQPVSSCPLVYNVSLMDYSTNASLGMQSTNGANLIFSSLTKYHPYYAVVTTTVVFNGQTASSSSVSSPTMYTMQDAPGAVVNLSVAPLSSVSLNVTWSAPTPNNTNGILSNYSLSWYSGSASVISAIVLPTVTQYTISNLQPCVTYNITVIAATVASGTPASTNSSTSGFNPSPPTSVSLNDSATNIFATWPTVNTSSCPAASYNACLSTSAAASVQCINTNGTIVTLPAQPYTAYVIQVFSSLTYLGIPYVSSVGTTQNYTTSQAPATAVTNVTQSLPASSSAVSVSWAPPSSPNGVISGYNVSWLVAGNCNTYPMNSDCNFLIAPNVTNIVVPGPNRTLTSCRNFTVSISPINGAGIGAPGSGMVYTSPNYIAAPNLTCTSTNVSVSCSWVPAADTFICPNTSVFFNVCVNSTQCQTLPSNTTSVFYSTFQPCYAYNVSVTPFVNDSYFGSLIGAGMSQLITTANSPPGGVTALTASPMSPTSVNVSWIAPNPMPCTVTSYNVSYSTVGAPNNGPCINNSVTVNASNSVLLSGLCACRTYTISVVAQTSSGPGPAVITTVTTPPTTPNSVTFSSPLALSNTSITFVWQPDSGTCYVTYNATLNPSGQSISTNATNQMFSELTPYVNYTLTVIVCTQPGLYNSTLCAPSSSNSQTTSQSVPGQPASIGVQSLSESSVNVFWTRPVNPYGIITSYYVSWTSNGSNSRASNGSSPVNGNSTLSYVVTNLTACATYTFSVAALTSVGIGSSVTSSATTFGIIRYALNWLAASVSANNVSVSVTPNPAEDCYNYIRYNVSTAGQATVLTSANTGYTFTGLTPYTSYSVIALQWVNGFVNVTSTNVTQSSQQVLTNQSAPGSASINLAPCLALNETAMSCSMSWQIPVKNGVLNTYYVYYWCSSLNANGLQTNVSTPVSNNSLSVLIYPQPYSSCTLVLTSSTYGGATNTMTTFNTGASNPPAVPSTSAVYHNVTQAIANAQSSVSDPTTQIRVALSFNPFSSSSGPVTTVQVLYAAGNLVSSVSATGTSVPTSSGWVSFYNYTPSSSQSTGSRRRRAVQSFSFDQTILGLSPGTGYTLVLRGWTSCCYSSIPLFVSTTPASQAGMIVGIVIGVLAALALVVVLIFLQRTGKINFKKGKSQKSNQTKSPGLDNNNYPLETIKSGNSFKHGISLVDFPNYVDTMHRDANLQFATEYTKLVSNAPKFPSDSATREVNRTKNRYADILPYDLSRVKLHAGEDQENDYINANYVPGFHSKREYLATQGPLQSTIDDFWRMTWEQNVHVIVMLTQVVERGRLRCEKYWPNEGQSLVYGEITVTCKSESTLADYTIRVLNISQNGACRTVTHCQFMTWPDRGCPVNQTVLLGFIRDVRTHQPKNQVAPICVHCSAGVGRTGTFICVDRLMEQINAGSTSINIYDSVMELRHHRCLMVQTEDQYVYIHDCIVEYLRERIAHVNEGYSDENEYQNMEVVNASPRRTNGPTNSKYKLHDRVEDASEGTV